MRLAARMSATLVVMLATAAGASAQSDSTVSVGVDVGADFPRSDRLEGSSGFGIAFRLPRPHGWSAAWDFGSIQSRLSHPIAATLASIGSLSVRPILGGAAYTRSFGRVEATLALTGGVALVRLDLDDSARERLRAAHGANDVRAERGVEPVLMPKATVWFDVNRWIGLTASGGYLFVRPTVVLADTSELERVDVTADTLRISGGIVVRIY